MTAKGNAIVTVLTAAVSLHTGMARVHGQDTASSTRTLIDQYCVGCHNTRSQAGGLVLDGLDVDRGNAETWEKVVKKLHARAMPPAGSSRPDARTYAALIASLEDTLDRAARAAPNPGRAPVHRLNRSQYVNVIRDLFGLEIDSGMLPADDSGFGFDNIGDVLSMSPGLLERYLLASTRISRLVVGDPTIKAAQTTYALPPLTLAQDDRMNEALPFGSRGGMAVTHYFPLDGEYSVKLTLQRGDVVGGYLVRGLANATDVEVRLDRERLKVFTVGGADAMRSGTAASAGYLPEEYNPDSALEVRFFAPAGAHVIGVSFSKDAWKTEGVGMSQLPLASDPFSLGRETGPVYGRILMGLDRIDVRGPFDGALPADSAARKRLFTCRPADIGEEPCAGQILGGVARRAYRRPVTPADLATLMEFYRQGRAESSFDAGIRTALARLLLDVNFLFRVERDPTGVPPGAAYAVSDLELASRLSFFLWNSIPDDELLNLAAAGRLRRPGVLERQARRMLADRRSAAFVDSFFGQWLELRKVAAARPDPKVFPDFDENLREAFQTETRMFLESQIREDRPAFDLLTANYTFANQRLARHYGIPDVTGSHFRRVTLPDNVRAGLLGQGSVLMTTSYNDRTSVVQRGKWVLDRVFGTPPPPPPPNVPSLDQTVVQGSLRQRMEQHRRNAVCASCHRTIDPLGFALENFDGIGTYRTHDGGVAVDASGVLADGTTFSGPAAFREALATRKDAFLGTLTENLLTYALGRGVEPYDLPSVRRILRTAARDDYRWSTLIRAIVASMPFQMRRAA